MKELIYWTLLIILGALLRRYLVRSDSGAGKDTRARSTSRVAGVVYAAVVALMVVSPLLAFYVSEWLFTDRRGDSAVFALTGLFALLPLLIGTQLTRIAGPDVHNSFWWLICNRGRFARSQVVTVAVGFAVFIAILATLEALS